MDDDLTHCITVTLHGKYAHGSEQENAQVRVFGDGSAGHFLQAFQAALVASGFATDTAASLSIQEP